MTCSSPQPCHATLSTETAHGYPKAHALACFAKLTDRRSPDRRDILADVLDPGRREAVEESLAGTQTSSSTFGLGHRREAPRLRPNSRTPAVSLFLSPTGDDLVLLAEDAETNDSSSTHWRCSITGRSRTIRTRGPLQTP